MRLTDLALLLAMVAAGGAVTACGTDAVQPPHQAAGAVDSTISREEALRRFRTGLRPADTLAGPASPDALMSAFVTAVAERDSIALGRLMLDRAEFAYLFYPTTPQGLPPYDLSPQIMWDLLARQSDRGLTDALRNLGGKRLTLDGYDCGSEPAREGGNLVWGPCTITLTAAPGGTATARLTGPVLEHAGRYKFISYTNELD